MSYASRVVDLSAAYSALGEAKWNSRTRLQKGLHLFRFGLLLLAVMYAPTRRRTANELDVVSRVTLEAALRLPFLRWLLARRALYLSLVGMERYTEESREPKFQIGPKIHTHCLLLNTASHALWVLGWKELSKTFHRQAATDVGLSADRMQQSRVYRGLALQAARYGCISPADRYIAQMDQVVIWAEQGGEAIWDSIYHKNNKARAEVERLLNR